jgi:hypothetical protein
MVEFEPYERKVHLYWDQEGALMPSRAPGMPGKPYANTLCRGNFAGPELLTTTDPAEVTCKTCLKDRRLQVALAQARPAPAQEIIRVVRVLEYWGPRASVEKVLQQNAVKGFVNFGSVTIREAMLPFPEVLDGQG